MKHIQSDLRDDKLKYYRKCCNLFEIAFAGLQMTTLLAQLCIISRWCADNQRLI